MVYLSGIVKQSEIIHEKAVRGHGQRFFIYSELWNDGMSI